MPSAARRAGSGRADRQEGRVRMRSRQPVVGRDTRPRGSPAAVPRVELSAVSRREAGGFTLVELLVVIAIVALLISILTPSLQRARDVTRSTICGSDLRQITHGFGEYAGANAGHLPDGQVAHSNPTDASTLDRNEFFEGRSGFRPFDLRPMARRYGFLPATWHIITGAPPWDDAGNTSPQLLRTTRSYFARNRDYTIPSRERFFSPNSMAQASGRAVMWSDMLRQTPQGEFYGAHGTGGVLLNGAASGESSWQSYYDMEPTGIHVSFYDGSARWADIGELDGIVRSCAYVHYFLPHD